MANIRLIARRICSIQGIAKTTKAMEMVSTSKMKRAQERVIAGRPYSEKMRQVLSDLSAQSQTDSDIHPLFKKRDIHNVAIVHITANRGLCGGLNTNVNRTTIDFVHGQSAHDIIITVGRKGRDFMTRRGRSILADFSGIGDNAVMADIMPISRLIIDGYIEGTIDQVYLAYTQFITTANVVPSLDQLLPIAPPQSEVTNAIDYIYEPSDKAVLEDLLPRFVEMQIYHALLESIASEQSSRMVTMRNATENANQLVDDFTLMYNKARQDMITSELLDITGGAEAVA